MTTTETSTAAAQGNGAGAPAKHIEVRNPATGEVIASVPALGVEDGAGVVARARAAQPAWEALGFEGRGRILRRAQKWVIENSDRIARTIVSENGKAYEDTGTILVFDPPVRLMTTHFSPASGRADIPENHHTVEYLLAGTPDGTTVTITQGNNSSEEEVASSRSTWQLVLGNLKEFLESTP